jgi:putative redox protein
MEIINMKANIVQVKGITFVGKAASNHWVSMDGPSDFLGSEAATRPKELILIGLGGCTGADVASILSKMREKLDKFEIDIEAESAHEHPKVFTKIHLKYKFWGDNLNKSNLEKAMNLSQDRYCSVTAMLKKSVELTHSYEINPDA